MIHDFGIVWSERALLLSGLANTAMLSTLAAIAALLLGFILTPALMSKRGAVSGAARAFVPDNAEIVDHAAASAATWRRSIQRCSDTSANTIGAYSATATRSGGSGS